MPTVHYALTHSIKRQWAEYWGLRPTATPIDLIRVLDECNPVTDLAAYDFEPTDGAELWEHDDIPDHAFIVKDSGVEWVVARMVPKKRYKAAALLKKKPKPVPVPPPVPVPQASITAIPDEPPPVLGECPPSSAADRYDWWNKQYHVVCDWLSRAREKHPQRGEVKQLLMRVVSQLRAAKEQAGREKDEAEMQTVTDADVLDRNGRLLLTPNVRWLLARVKELQARVEQLESQREVKPQ